MNAIETYKKHFLLLVVIWMVVPYNVWSQWNEISLSTVGTEDDLTMQVNAIEQDSFGYMYFGGNQGLKRFDGSTFKHFYSIYGDSTSLSTGEINKIKFSKSGDLWITMRYGGVNRFSPDTESFKRYQLSSLSDAFEQSCQGILIDEKDDIWFGSGQIQLYQLDKKADTLIAYSPSWLKQNINERFIINTILQDVSDPDIFWLSVTDFHNPKEKREGYGVVSFNRKTKKFKPHRDQARLVYQKPNGILVSTFNLDSYMEWDPLKDELIVYENKASEERSFISRNVIPVANGFWMHTAGSIHHIDQNHKNTILYKSEEDEPFMYSLFADKDENIWIGTAQGVKVYNKKRNLIKSFSLTTFDDYHRIYPGRLAYDSKNNQILLSHSSRERKNRLYRIKLNPNEESDFLDMGLDILGLSSVEDHVYASSRKGFSVTESSGNNTTLQSINEENLPWHWNMKSSIDGTIGLIGFYDFYFKRKDENSWNVISIDSIPYSIGRQNGEYFLGQTFISNEEAIIFSNQIYSVNLKNENAKLIHPDPTFNPLNQEIFDVVADRFGFIWAAGQDYLGKFERKKDSLVLIKRYTAHDGLNMSQVTELFVDYENRIWCFTANGVCAIDESSDQIRKYGLFDGLPQIFTDPRQIIELPDHRIATVNKNGIILFDPKQLWESKSIQTVPININELRIDGSPLEKLHRHAQNEKIELPYGDQVIDINFQGLTFPTANHLTYSYRLLGLNEKWIDIGKNQIVTLSGLSPGDYTFEVKAGNPNISSPITRLNIEIKTPFYQSLWFLLGATIVLLTLLYLLYKWRVQNIEKDAQQQIQIDKKIAELELSALRAQMNPHFMFNSLNSIKNFILSSEPRKASEYLSNFAHLIRLILQNSKESTVSLEEELETLELYIELEQMRFDESFEYICQVDEGIALEEIDIPPMILQPYIENAIWHGLMHQKGSRTLNLHVKRADVSTIYCIIEDNGIGRKSAQALKDNSMQRYKSMGMGITKDRIDIMNKIEKLGIDVEIIDKESKGSHALGTRVIVKIPYQENKILN